MDIQVTLQQFGGDNTCIRTVTVPPEMPLGQLRTLARYWVDRGQHVPGAIYIGSVCVVLVVAEHRCTEMEMDNTLTESNIANGTCVTVIRMDAPAIPPLIQNAEDKLLQALAAIADAKQSPNSDGDAQADLDTAQQRLQDYTYPLARSAADANQLIQRVLKFYIEEYTYDDITSRALQNAEQVSRDIVTLLCRANLKEPRNRQEFIKNCKAAFEGDWGGLTPMPLLGQMLLAYHFVPSMRPGGFPSRLPRQYGCLGQRLRRQSLDVSFPLFYPSSSIV